MPAQKDVLRLLKDDHEKVRKLFQELERAPSRKAKSVLQKLKHEIDLHSEVEEQIVYPAFRNAAGSKEAKVMVAESMTEHMLVDVLMGQLQDLRAGTAEFEGKVSVLKESVLHHAKEEEKEMFPAMRKAAHAEDLVDLGRQVLERKRAKEGGNARHVESAARMTRRQGRTREELYEQAKRQDIAGRSSMSKRQLELALRSD